MSSEVAAVAVLLLARQVDVFLAPLVTRSSNRHRDLLLAGVPVTLWVVACVMIVLGLVGS